jgi:hypothetical protein
MARTIEQIYAALVFEKINQPTLISLQPAIDDEQTLLSDLTTPSRVAVWRLWLFITAVAIYVHETLWDLFKAEVEEIASKAVAGTPRWYQEQCFKFQYGDTLQWIDNKYQYSIIDPTKQIVKRAAVVEVGNQVRIKVAKLSGSAVVPLTSAELAAFDAYIHQIKFAGTNTATLSRVPDLLKVYFKIYYDPLVLTPTGALITDAGTFPAEAAIQNYIANLPFNGDLVLTNLVDAVQVAVGVVNPILLSAEAKYGALPYATIVEKYNPDAGHMAIDPAFLLSTTITYVPYV